LGDRVKGEYTMSHVYEIITERILGKLEQGVVPWHKPWEQGIPRNLPTKKPYRGVNVFLTASAGFASPYWLTLKRLCLKSRFCDRFITSFMILSYQFRPLF
jgi:antirestriction protein ArdC